IAKVIRGRSMQPPPRIAIVVHGRFHAFDLARELIRQGTRVVLLTNYPKYIAEKFGVPRKNVINCVAHGVVSRLVERAGGCRWNSVFEPFLHSWFSRWAARALSSIDIDAIYVFSGVSEELMLSVSSRPVLKSLVRGSAHIRTQARLLEQEQARCGRRMNLPSVWRIAREEREY